MFLFLLALLAPPAQAAPNCAKIGTYLDFFSCTVDRHPRMEIAKEKVREAGAVFDKASQLPNPQLGVKSVGTTEITVLLPISQLWTRGAQRGMATAEKKVAEVEARQTQLDFKKELIRDLYRLRQVESGLELVGETLEAFETIRRQLSARRARGPDQEITLNLVQLAASDYQLRNNHLQVERAEIQAKLKAIWGRDFELKRSFLPPLRDKWPELKLGADLGNNLAVQKAMAEAERASSEQNLAGLEALPNLTAGPVFERSAAGPSRNWAYGFAVEMNLPVFSWNGGARAVAQSRTTQAELEAAYAARRFESEREILLMKYRTAVDSLSRASNREEMKRKHERVDSFFRQGLASGGLVIEAHRQIVEYQNSQHEHENTAIDAYIDLMTLTGGEVEGILK